jgi:F0F1-type ATP synthase membrane subunit c/vacuolar-type H+-ATPase subunit K
MSCASPLHTDFWGILYDWQSIIAGIFAIVAAAIGAIAAYCVGNAQIAAAEQKDRLQARSLAVAILPEILQLRVHHERAKSVIHQELPKIKPTNLNTNVVYTINLAVIELPNVKSECRTALSAQRGRKVINAIV